MKEKEIKYLVTADISNIPYSTEQYLFGIFDSKEDALNFIKSWKPKRKRKNDEYDNDYKTFNFFGRFNRKLTDEELENYYIDKFDGTPICVGAYYE